MVEKLHKEDIDLNKLLADPEITKLKAEYIKNTVPPTGYHLENGVRMKHLLGASNFFDSVILLLANKAANKNKIVEYLQYIFANLDWSNGDILTIALPNNLINIIQEETGISDVICELTQLYLKSRRAFSHFLIVNNDKDIQEAANNGYIYEENGKKTFNLSKYITKAVAEKAKTLLVDKPSDTNPEDYFRNEIEIILREDIRLTAIIGHLLTKYGIGPLSEIIIIQLPSNDGEDKKLYFQYNEFFEINPFSNGKQVLKNSTQTSTKRQLELQDEIEQESHHVYNADYTYRNTRKVEGINQKTHSDTHKAIS